MVKVNVHDAKTHLSRLLTRVEGGEEVIIARDGRPIAKLVPFAGLQKRVPGLGRGEMVMSDDFDAPLPNEILDAFR